MDLLNERVWQWAWKLCDRRCGFGTRTGWAYDDSLRKCARLRVTRPARRRQEPLTTSLGSHGGGARCCADVQVRSGGYKYEQWHGACRSKRAAQPRRSRRRGRLVCLTGCGAKRRHLDRRLSRARGERFQDGRAPPHNHGLTPHRLLPHGDCDAMRGEARRCYDLRIDSARCWAKVQRRSWDLAPTIGPTHKILRIVFLGHGDAI
jgi:hypothetical protein